MFYQLAYDAKGHGLSTIMLTRWQLADGNRYALLNLASSAATRSDPCSPPMLPLMTATSPNHLNGLTSTHLYHPLSSPDDDE
jgi:hypothetical protein